MNRDLLVSADTKSSHSVTGLRIDGGLTRQLLKHLGGTSQTITRLADTDVENKLLNLELSHGVGALVGRLLLALSFIKNLTSKS
jgi:hypothetical protein